jgi:peptidoglycan/LPS O-acetylase OafA/YrhL
MTTILRSTVQPQNYRPDIDGLRAVAVLAVVGYHFFPNWIKGGFVGVDIFFVISGFLIGGILLDMLRKEQFSLLEFYGRRVRRILPALILVMVSCLAFGWFALLPDDYQNLGKHTAGGAGFIANLMFWQEAGYFDVAAERKPLLHLWSLGVEEQFYIIFPLFLWGLWKKNLRLATFVVLLALLSYKWNLETYKKSPDFDFYMPMTRFWELLAGVLLALWERRRTQQNVGTLTTGNSIFPIRAKKFLVPIKERITCALRQLLFREQEIVAKENGCAFRSLLSCLGILLLAIALVKAQTEHFPGKQALFPVLGAVCLIAAGPRAWWNRVLLACRPAVWIGLISYPLYLWHWPLLSYARIILGEMPDRMFRIGMLVVAVGLATATYWIVERPVRFGKRARGIKTIILLGLLVGMGSVGEYVFWKEGMPARKSLPVKENVLAKIDANLFDKNPENHSCEHLADYQADKEYQTCDYHNVNGKETVALVGHSHSRVAFPDVAAYNASKGINTLVLWRPGLANPIDRKQHTNHMDIADNTRFSEWVFSTLARDPKIHKVFLFADRDNMQEAIDRLHAAGKQVYAVEEHPHLPFDIKTVLPEQPFRPKKKIQVLRSREDERYATVRQRTSQWKNVKVVYTRDVFCPIDECLLFDMAGRPLYFDISHWTCLITI